MNEALGYRVSIDRPSSHLARVELTIPADLIDSDGTVMVGMASWCPGSYLVRDYARFVREVEARQGDERLEVQQISKREWQVRGARSADVIISYQVYGRDLSVRTNHIDDSHAFLHSPALFLFPDSGRDRPCQVVVSGPSGRDWPIVCGLEQTSPGVMSADDIDELLDSPIHLGPVELRRFDAAGCAIELAVYGYTDLSAPYDLDDLERDVAKLVATHAAGMGGMPCRRYLFLLMLSSGAYGGLEHRASSANLNSPFAFAAARSYYELLELLSHELFHVWNGKRIVPQSFERFDYAVENYTRCLWVVEGLTSYYDRYGARRAGVVPVSFYLTKLCEEWGRLQLIPGRKLHSLQEASLNAWVKLYKPHESNVNSTVSYYLKGGLVMLALDLDLRSRTGGEVTLDRVLSHLWHDYGRRARGYPEELQPVFEAATDLDLGEFFDRYVRGTEDPELDKLLAGVGLRMVTGWEGYKAEEGSPAPVWLGLSMSGGGRSVAAVLDGSPADRAGLDPGDEIIAIDRYRIASESELRQRLAGRQSGSSAEVAVFRRGQLELSTVQLDQSPPTRYEIHGQSDASDSMRKRFREWLGQPHSAGLLATGAITNTL